MRCCFPRSFSNYFFRVPSHKTKKAMSSYIFSLFAVSCVITVTLAIPYQNSDSRAFIEARSINCSDLHAPTDSSCWQELDLTTWLKNWNQTTPTCNEDQDGADCCQIGEVWNTCFLRLAHRSPGSDCTQINAQACTWSQYLAVDRDIAPQVFYVMTNIYCTLPSHFVSLSPRKTDKLTSCRQQ